MNQFSHTISMFVTGTLTANPEFSFELQDGSRPWHLVHNRQLGLYDLWGSLRGWGGGSECSRIWMLASPFFLSLSLSLNLSETRPAPLHGSRLSGLLLKSQALAGYHRPELSVCLVISDATAAPPWAHRCHHTPWAASLSARLRVTLAG